LRSFGFARYAVLGSLMKQTVNGNINKYNGCVSLRYNSDQFFAHFFAIVYKRPAT